MLIRETRKLLTMRLHDAGVNPSMLTTGDVQTVVETFRQFAELPVEDAALPEEDGDAILAQFGTYDLRGKPEFSADLTRQLAGAGGGEHSPMWQLSCTLYWSPSPVTDVLASGHLWSFGRTLDEFFTEASALGGWAWALGGVRAPRSLAITLDEV